MGFGAAGFFPNLFDVPATMIIINNATFEIAYAPAPARGWPGYTYRATRQKI